MRISDIAVDALGLLGYGLEGAASHRALRAAGFRGEVRVLTDAPVAVPSDALTLVGADARAGLDGLGLLIRSPGFPPHHPLRRAADARGLPQTTATNLFLAELRAAGIPVIGITGSKGKSTTSTLVTRMLTAAGRDAVLVGNIGVPALAQLAEVRARRPLVVMELSSYQCDGLVDGEGPPVACLLDLFPEHLDWHGGVAAYYAAKWRIAATQRTGDAFLCNANVWEPTRTLPGAVELINQPDGWHFSDGWFCRRGERLFADTALRLPGLHNRRNAVAALALAARFGVGPVAAEAALADFAGLPYRLEDEGMQGGVRWYNDSIATAPEAVVAALAALGPAVATLICGGHDRGYRFEGLAAAAAASAVGVFILLPDTGAAIAPLLRAGGPGRTVVEVGDLAEAVALAHRLTAPGRACLFSPGAPSYNVYASFAERGAHFRALVRDLGTG